MLVMTDSLNKERAECWNYPFHNKWLSFPSILGSIPVHTSAVKMAAGQSPDISESTGSLLALPSLHLAQTLG